jgi:hypothetical protein
MVKYVGSNLHKAQGIEKALVAVAEMLSDEEALGRRYGVRLEQKKGEGSKRPPKSVVFKLALTYRVG